MSADTRSHEHVTLRSWEARTERPLLFGALLFLIVVTVPIIDPPLPSGVDDAVRTLDVGIWLMFAADYVIRLRLAPRRWNFIRTHVPDALMVALPALRPLRLLRLGSSRSATCWHGGQPTGLPPRPAD